MGFERRLVDLVTAFSEVFVYIAAKHVHILVLVSRFLFQRIFARDLDVWHWRSKYLSWDVLQKTIFAEVGILTIPGSIFHDFGWPGPFFMSFVALETGSKFDKFSG